MGRGPVTAALERRVAAEVRRRAPDLVDLLATLVASTPACRAPTSRRARRRRSRPILAGRLEAAGLAVEVWEPDIADLPPTRYPIPPGHHFRGRPQLVARRAGTGGGRSLLFNGHIDVVSAEPVERWTTDPFRADVRDGRLYGRGACDMKGGVAAMVLATEVLCALDVPLRGDLLVNTVTDEESTAAGCWRPSRTASPPTARSSPSRPR